MNNQVTLKKSNKIRTIDLALAGMFTAIICVMAQITIPTQPIPFTLSLFAIFLTGALLSPRFAFLSVLAYLLIGLVGVPVFAGFQSGFQRLAGPTGGYLMSYPIMAFVTALFYQWFKKYKAAALAAGMILSLILCYTLGTLWFAYSQNTSFIAALSICVFPYVLFDILKAVLAIFVSLVIRKTVYKGLGI